MYHKLSVVQKKKEVIQEYAEEILKPLDQFQTKYYKFLVKYRNEEICKLLEREYDLYLEKLEVFYHILSSDKEDSKKDSL